MMNDLQNIEQQQVATTTNNEEELSNLNHNDLRLAANARFAANALDEALPLYSLAVEVVRHRILQNWGDEAASRCAECRRHKPLKRRHYGRRQYPPDCRHHTPRHYLNRLYRLSNMMLPQG